MTFYDDVRERFGAEVERGVREIPIDKHGDALMSIQVILENHGIVCHGVEAISEGEGCVISEDKPYFPRSWWQSTVALYINRGDTYEATILYDVAENEYIVTSWGDWYEANMVDQSEKLLKEAIEEELYRLDIDNAMAEAIIAYIKEDTQIDYDYYVKFKAEKVKEIVAEILGDFTYIPQDKKADILDDLGGRIVNSYHRSVIFDGVSDPQGIFDSFLSDLLD